MNHSLGSPMSRILTGIMLAGLALTGCRNAGPEPNSNSKAGKQATAMVAPDAASASKRLVFPWSVVSGGVDSATSMRRAMEEDAVVATHYSGLNPAEFKLQVLPESRSGYVSYRIRDKVYWTRRMVTLQAGESVLSDGRTMVRGRCGNLVSATAREPVAPDGAEPPEPAMDVPASEAQLVTTPPLPVEAVVAAETFVNPKQLADNKEMSSVLPAPAPQESLPPSYASGGSGPMAFIGGASSSAAGGTPSSPTPESATATAPGTPELPASVTPIVSGGIATPPLEIAPPMVLISLTIPPETPAPPPSIIAYGDTWVPPTPINYSPVAPPTITIQPPANPPGTPPVTTNPPPPFTPPSSPPPTDPPSGPPPGTEPPGNPPFPPPPPPPPPDAAVPEPGAWVLLVLGLAGIAIGSARKKTE
jgi:hypothetical protein